MAPGARSADGQFTRLPGPAVAARAALGTEESVEDDLEHRLRGVINRRRTELSGAGMECDEAGHARRLAHNRLIHELPRVSAKIARAIAELNDRLYDSEICLKVVTAEHTPIAEAIYTIGILGSDNQGPGLIITIDYAGSIRCMLKNAEVRTLVGSYTLLTLDHRHLIDMLVTLLEAHYH